MNKLAVLLLLTGCAGSKDPVADDVDPPADETDDSDPIAVDTEPEPPIETDTPVVAESDPPPETDAAETDPAETDPVEVGPTFAPVVFTELAEWAHCGGLCEENWEVSPGRVAQEHPIGCAAEPTLIGMGDNPDHLVCYMDYLRGDVRGVIDVLDVPTRTWLGPPRADRGDFIAAGILEAGNERSHIGELRFVAVDAGSDQVSMLLRGPTGPLLRLGVDGLWRRDEQLRSVWVAAGFRAQGHTAVADLNEDGLPDLLQMRCDETDLCTPVVFYRQPNGGWQWSANFLRISGASSDVYEWAILRLDEGFAIAAAGDGRYGAPSGLFVPAGLGGDGYPAWEEVPGTQSLSGQGMGVYPLDLLSVSNGAPVPGADGVPELIVSTTFQCPEVLQRVNGLWLNANALTSRPIPNRWMTGCWNDVTPGTEELVWGMAEPAPGLLLVAQGDDGRVLNGLCPADPICPEDQPFVGYRAYEGQLWEYPASQLTFRDPDGRDVSMGNRRTIDQFEVAGSTLIATRGVYWGKPQLFIVEPPAP